MSIKPDAQEDERINGERNPDLSRQHLAKVIRYEKPQKDRDRQIVSFGRTDSMMVFMQVLKHAGEETLHKHPNTDSFWWVVRGRVAFFTTDHALLAELGPEEGVLLPRDYPYYFRAIGDEDLEILQMESFLRQGERLQSVFLEERKTGEYDVTQTGDYVA